MLPQYDPAGVTQTGILLRSGAFGPSTSEACCLNMTPLGVTQAGILHHSGAFGPSTSEACCLNMTPLGVTQAGILHHSGAFGPSTSEACCLNMTPLGGYPSGYPASFGGIRSQHIGVMLPQYVPGHPSGHPEVPSWLPQALLLSEGVPIVGPRPCRLLARMSQGDGPSTLPNPC